MTEPDAQPWQRLHPDVLKVTALTMVGVAVLVGGVTAVIMLAAGVSLGVTLAWVLPGAVLPAAAVTGYDALRLRFTRYRVTGTRVELQTGVLFKTRRSLARERVRSVDLTANPLSRALGLVRVKVGTGERGGGTGAATERSVDLDSVARADGEQLRVDLLRRAGHTTDDDGTERLATWRPAWTRYGALSFGTPLLAAAVVGAVFQVADWFGRGGMPVEIAMDLAGRYGAWQVFGLAVVVLVVLGALGTTALHVEAWWNHRLDREPGGTLRVQRGLVFSRSLSLEEKRIRGVEVVEPLAIRSARAARLDVIAIGLGTDDPGSDLSTLVPAVPAQVAWASARSVAGPLGAAPLTGHPRAARHRRLRRAALGILGLAAVLVGVHLVVDLPTFWAVVTVLAGVLLTAWTIWWALDSYASLGHALDGDYLVARRGSVRRGTAYLRRSGIIGWRIRRSFFQRRLGLVTIDAVTAAGRGHYATVDADEPDGLAFAEAAVPGLLGPFLVPGPAPYRDRR